MPAPGAKCPDCIIAARRVRDEQTLEQRAVAGASTEGFARDPEEAMARDKALVDLLRHGPAAFERLMTVVPGVDLSKPARERACRAAVLRLKVKNIIKIVPEGYALA